MVQYILITRYYLKDFAEIKLFRVIMNSPSAPSYLYSFTITSLFLVKTVGPPVKSNDTKLFRHLVNELFLKLL